VRRLNAALRGELKGIFRINPPKRGSTMESIHTLQEFMLQTKNIIYILIVLALVAMPLFWVFLTGKDEE
jgi:hypothetical protein